jgi:hypothetical protein
VMGAGAAHPKTGEHGDVEIATLALGKAFLLFFVQSSSGLFLFRSSI